MYEDRDEGHEGGIADSQVRHAQAQPCDDDESSPSRSSNKGLARSAGGGSEGRGAEGPRMPLNRS
eukprot:CAMPEP_0174725902 /NCGR_PEP_ID=MMETSP1094-20130205/46648_1 /TAXON_ID=156173 /ORGANISM="Chrysochromulina brevifilum, Strain UTEX LB 985" /LENGTH=64 /DNA_ID=CAMNT_0015927389 /DNA_START=1119 /DNA_END=1313 /DNA_ORIENTATION=+